MSHFIAPTRTKRWLLVPVSVTNWDKRVFGASDIKTKGVSQESFFHNGRSTVTCAFDLKN